MQSTRTAAGSKTLEGRYYLCDEIYQRETEQIFDAQWLCIGRVEEVPDAGSYVLVELEGESLIVLRGDDQQVRCFYNVCRHRGARLCEEPRGSVGKSLSCPYHAWTYDLQGRLVATPNVRPREDFAKCDFPLKALATATWEGFVFANFSPDPIEFETAYSPLLEKFRPWSISELAPVRQLQYEVRANWKMLFQNYSECYHCPRVHPLLNTLSAYRTATNDLLQGPFLGGPMQLAEGVGSMSSDGQACGALLPRLNDADRRRVYYYTIFPTMFLSLHPDFVLVHRLYRRGAETTRVLCDFLFPAAAGFDPQPAVDFWDQTNKQDWRVCELSQQGVSSRSYEPAPYTDIESTVAQFDRHYLQIMNLRQ